MYESLTKFIKNLDTDKYGEWHGGECDNKGTMVLPFVVYSVIVHQFVDGVYEFVDTHKDWNLNRYYSIIEVRCNDFQVGNLNEVNLNVLDGRTVVALIVSIIRGDRFCEGMLLSAFENGTIIKFLKRLKEIDETERNYVAVKKER